MGLGNFIWRRAVVPLFGDVKFRFEPDGDKVRASVKLGPFVASARLSVESARAISGRLSFVTNEVERNNPDAS